MDVKSIMSRAVSGTSTTYIGVIVAGIMSIGHMAGVDLVEQDVSNIVMLAALGLIVIGRAKAKGPSRWWTALFGGAKSSGSNESGNTARSMLTLILASALGMCAVAAFVSASGCASLQQQTNTTLYEMADTYMDLHQDYVTAYDASDEDGRAWMRSQVAPFMDRAKHMLDLTLTAAIAGQDVESDDLSEVKAALTEAALAIADIFILEDK